MQAREYTSWCSVPKWKCFVTSSNKTSAPALIIYYRLTVSIPTPMIRRWKLGKGRRGWGRDHRSLELLLGFYIYKPVTWTHHNCSTRRKPSASWNSPIFSDECSSHSDGRRTSGAGTAPLYDNNQIFRVRDVKENSRNSRKALLAKCSWDTGEPDSGLCSELEQDVNKSAWVSCILEFSASSGDRAEICE